MNIRIKSSRMRISMLDAVHDHKYLLSIFFIDDSLYFDCLLFIMRYKSGGKIKTKSHWFFLCERIHTKY